MGFVGIAVGFVGITTGGTTMCLVCAGTCVGRFGNGTGVGKPCSLFITMCLFVRYTQGFAGVGVGARAGGGGVGVMPGESRPST